MRDTYTKIFVNHPHLVAEMLTLRLSGWEVKPLARLFRVDKSTIKVWCRKFDIEPRITFSVNYWEPTMEQKRHYTIQIDKERINPGKSYKEYLQEAANRKKRYVSH